MIFLLKREEEKERNSLRVQKKSNKFIGKKEGNLQSCGVRRSRP